MIVKIWPVKGKKGLSQCLRYVDDDAKVLQSQTDDGVGFVQDMDDIGKDFGKDVRRVFVYVADEDKTMNKYVSGYMCDPETAVEDFEAVWLATLDSSDEPGHFSGKETLCFHMVQSFPDDLIISDEEVHQCGIELLKKLDKHQGVVCSHVHPVVDERGEVHGRAKHNHIVFNAYICPEKREPEHPNRRKYNDCTTTYRQLQIWNDEIAIEHGLPIIQDPDLMRNRSWKESTEEAHERSWKQYTRWDIERAKRESSNWEEFTEKIQHAGYTLRGEKTLTYITPYGSNKIRAARLGREYTKESMELFWTIRDRINIELIAEMNGEKVPILYELSLQHSGPLTVDVPLGLAGKEENKYYPLPLIKADRDRRVLTTYFNSGDLYDIRDAEGQFVSKATGEEVVYYLDALRRGEEERFRQLHEEIKKSEEHRRLEDIIRQSEKEHEKQKKEEQSQKTREQHRYYISKYKNTRTGQPYKTFRYDSNGRRRSSLELMFMLAITIIKNEAGLWDVPNPPPEKRTDPMFATPDWKLQAMYDAYQVAKEEDVYTLYDINNRLDQLGAEFGHAKKAVDKTARALETMKKAEEAIEDYRATCELSERILALPDGEEKEQMKKQYAQELGRYRRAKNVLYANRLMTNNKVDAEAIYDFRRRHEDMEKNLPQMRQRFDDAKEAYRRMKKLQYQTQLADNQFFCYGPKYSPERAEQRKNRGVQVTAKEFDRYSQER